MIMSRIVRLALGTAATTALMLTADGGNAASALPKNVSHWVASAEKVGSAAETQQVHFSMFLGFRNQDDLKTLIKAQSTPGNPLYGQYLTPDKFRERFAPDAGKVALVQDTLRKLGFTVEFTPKSGLFVQAAGSVAQVKSAFGVSQNLYSYKGRTLRANAETPRLPAKIADIITYVGGLDDTASLRKPLHISYGMEAQRGAQAANDATARTDASRAPSAPPPVQAGTNSEVCSDYWGDHTATLSTAASLYPQSLPWLVCGYTPQQLRQAYGADKVPHTGKGVRVAIVDVYASPTIVQDANTYSANHGLPKLTYLNFQQIVPPGLYNVKASDPCGPQDWYGEETLDVEAVHSMAPNAFILYGGITCSDPGNAALYNFIDNHLADIITNSYTFDGEDLPADFIASEEQFFMQAAAEGISVLFSSGDDGDLANNDGSYSGNGIASGAFEATSPYVTAVGGTSLALVNKAGKKSEWGWGDYRAFLGGATVAASGKTIKTTGAELPFAFYGGSGGGPSLSLLALPYQRKVPARLSEFTVLADDKTKVPLESPHRVTPDIAMVADPYTGFLYGETYTKANDPILDKPCVSLSKTTEYCEQSIGGTSLSSPLFAGVLALVDQARFNHGKPAVGLVNPLLYILPVGAPGTTATPIIDIQAPTTPTALLRGYLGDNTKVRVVTMNSAPNLTGTQIIAGADTSYNTTAGYDEVTGLGTPYVPALIQSAINQ